MLEVVNPSSLGGASEKVAYFVESPAPSISSLSPRTVAPGKAATVTLAGKGFESNSTVQWNGSTRPTTFVSATVLKVALTAADLKSEGTGLIAVNNPAPGGSTSQATFLSITSSALPVIQSVLIAAAPGINTECQQLQVTVTGQNFGDYGVTIQANGVSLQNQYGSGSTSTSASGFLPLGFVSQPGALSFTVTNSYPAGVVSQPFAYPSSSGPILSLCGSSSLYTPTVFTNSSFAVNVRPSEVNIAGSGAVTLGTLPVGFTATAMKATLPPSGTTFQVTAGTRAKQGSYSLVLNGAAGGATAAGQFNFTLASGTPPGFGFYNMLQNGIEIPIGGSTQVVLYSNFLYSSGSPANSDYYVTPSAKGLPAGVKASFLPAVFVPGQSVTLTLTAAANAPATQNANITITGKPSVNVSSASTQLTAFVSLPPDKLAGSRTDFVSAAGTPYAAAYDQAHNLIFASNPTWNRVNVISGKTHKIIKSITVRSPRGIDITPNGQSVWVQTAAQYVFKINTTTLQAKEYLLPKSGIGSSGLPIQFASDSILALSDGTVFLYFNDSGSEGSGEAGVWNPKTGTMKVLSPQEDSAWGIPVRSGDGNHVYAANDLYDNGVEHYNVLTGELTKIGTAQFWSILAVNHNGTRLVTGPGGYTPLGIYDQNLKWIATLPSSSFDNRAGVVFSSDDSKIYEVAPRSDSNQTKVLFTVDGSTHKVLGTAPSTGVMDIFASDSTGMVFGIDTYGISFDDAADTQKFGANEPTSPGSAYGVYDGPLSGGGVFNLYSSPTIEPSAWFGSVRGVTSAGNGTMTFIAPPSATSGPVNVKLYSPDGSMWLYPQEFGYGTDPEYAVTSGSSPAGGAAAEIIGYGLPQDAGSGTVSVGGVDATITTKQGQYPPYSGEPYPSTKLDFILPPGQPGWADLQVNTAIGFGELPKSILYAKSVTDYASKDKFNALLFDRKRNVVYASAGDHIDVFSVKSHKFLSPLHPAGTNPRKNFVGLALTPDGSKLLAAESDYGGLSVIDPDAPSSSYAVSVPANAKYVAATSDGRAFVSSGSPNSPSTISIVDLKTRVVAVPASCASGSSLESTINGNYVAIGDTNCIYSVEHNTFTTEQFSYNTNWTVGFGGTIAGDGNIFGSFLALGDMNGNPLGDVALPFPLYSFLGPFASQTSSPSPILLPKLNDAGSLYYFAYPNSFEIVDVAHGLLRLRFALTETVTNSAESMAIDAGGRFVFLTTNKGLTEVDLGAAPLSIAHLSVSSAAPGTAVTVRGSGFEAGMTAMVAGLDATVKVTDENTLTLIIPNAASGPQDILVTRTDGESYTLDNGITVL
jgi:hypothetical protein